MRSMLFVPGDSRRKLDKAVQSDADALIIDLEDSVDTHAKRDARHITADFIKEATSREACPLLYVRVNDLATGLTGEDLDIVMSGAPDGIMLPKAVGGHDIERLDESLRSAEETYGIAPGNTKIIPIATETALGVLRIGSIVGSSRRLAGVTWGAEDLSADIGAETNRGADGLYTDPYRYARVLCLLTATAAEVIPVDTIYAVYRDADGLRRECDAARRDGFVAKMAIHPQQVQIINEAFTPTADALAEAREIVRLFAEKPGAGVVGLRGQMLDRPHLRRAERIVASADRSPRNRS